MVEKPGHLDSQLPGPLELKVGGPISPGVHIYIKRPEDDELYELLLKHEYVNVLSSRQVGKSSLMYQTSRRLANARVSVVTASCSELVGADMGAWYRGFLRQVARGLTLDEDVNAWWFNSTAPTPNQKLADFMCQVVAPHLQSPLVIFLDEIDATLQDDFTDHFFVAIREMYNQRCKHPEFEQITFCLLGVATPNELIKNPRTTPYNVGRTLELRDFDSDRDDLSSLSKMLSSTQSTAKMTLHAILKQTGGHPFLTACLCEEVQRRADFAQLNISILTSELFENLNAVRRDVHFETILNFLTVRVRDRLATLELYERVLGSSPQKDATTPEHLALKLAGIVRRDRQNCLVVRNAIYARLFDDAWVQRSISVELHSQQLALSKQGSSLVRIREERDRAERLWRLARFVIATLGLCLFFLGYRALGRPFSASTWAFMLILVLPVVLTPRGRIGFWLFCLGGFVLTAFGITLLAFYFS